MEQLEKLKAFLQMSMLILPIPVSKLAEQEKLNDILNKNLVNGTLVLWRLLFGRADGNFKTARYSLS